MKKQVKYRKYSKELCKEIENQLANGTIISELCNNLDISEAIFYKWKSEGKIELLEAIKKGKKRAIKLVENALFKSAIGYSYLEKKVEVQKEKMGDKMVAVGERQTNIEKRVLANPVSMIFFLKNRDPENWKDKQDIEHSGEMGVKIIRNNPRRDLK